MIGAGLAAKFAGLAIPRQVWWVGAGALLLSVGYCKHQGAVENVRKEARAEADKEWRGAYAEMEKASRQWRSNYENAATQVSMKIGEINAKERLHSAALANALRVRGPGKAAACTGPRNAAVVSTPTGGHEPAAGRADAPVDGLPDDTPLAIVPWPDLVTRAQDADDNLAEVKAWRSYYLNQKELRELKRSELPKVAF